jgi:hypothetical protein
MSEQGMHPVWDIFRKAQEQVGSTYYVNTDSRGAEDALLSSLDLISPNKPLPAPEFFQRKLDNLMSNRGKKHRQRLKLQRQRDEEQVQLESCGTRKQISEKTDRTILQPPSSPEEPVLLEGLIALIRPIISEQDLVLLCEVANDDLLSDVAHRHNMKLGTLKSKVSRARALVRRSLSGEIIREVLLCA